MTITSFRDIKDPAILGAGPAGLAVAWRLSQAGCKPLVFEKEKAVGGLATTFETDGYRFDLGPHVLHPKYLPVLQFLKKRLGQEIFAIQPTAKILFKHRYVQYPLQGLRVLTSLPWYLVIPAGLSYVWTRMKLTFRQPVSDNSFAEWITNRFGSVLYNIYFGPYAEKVWKISGSKLSAHVAKKRVPVISIRDLLRRLLHMTPRETHSEYDAILGRLYCRLGVGQFCDTLARDVKDAGGEILADSKVLSIEGRNRRVESVTVEHGGVIRKHSVDYLFSTIPLPQLIELLRLDIPDVVRQAAKELDYCAERFLYLKIVRATVPFPSILYLSDPTIPINRIFNVGDFSADCVPKDRSALCVEFTCNQGDGVWNASDDELFEQAMTVLEKAHLLKRTDIEGYMSKRTAYAYPRFRVGFEVRLACVLGYLQTLENLKTLGRQGLFNYANVDDAVNMAFGICDALMDKKATVGAAATL